MKQGPVTPGVFSGSATALLEPEVRETQPSTPLLRVKGLSKTYEGNSSTRRGTLKLFQNLDLEVHRGELVAIVGQSGSGKSTLLHMLGALDTPSAGTIYCASTHVNELTPQQAARFRNQQVGYVWQFHYLLPEFTAQENVAMPLLARGESRQSAMRQAATWLSANRLGRPRRPSPRRTQRRRTATRRARPCPGNQAPAPARRRTHRRSRRPIRRPRL